MIPLTLAIAIGKVLLVAALFVGAWRLFRGPTLTDRVVAIDLIAGIVLSFSLLIALESGRSLYLTVAFAIAVVTFIGTIAIARHLERQGRK
ncbi:MAG: monovalent cation/H+ antiporter complex subunit F [Verrucomicrobiota bacterium]